MSKHTPGPWMTDGDLSTALDIVGGGHRLAMLDEQVEHAREAHGLHRGHEDLGDEVRVLRRRHVLRDDPGLVPRHHAALLVGEAVEHQAAVVKSLGSGEATAAGADHAGVASIGG